MNENFNTGKIEADFRAAVKAQNVSRNVFSNRPKSKEANLNDFVVVSVSTGGVRSLAAVGTCVVSFSLFAKDVANMKNDEKLSVMESRLLDGFPTEVGDCLFDEDDIIVRGDTHDNAGYHVRIIQIGNIIIKTA